MRPFQMPIYEYRCPNGHTFELFQRMTDPPPDGCAVCGEAPVEKMLFPVAVHFKGSGFHATDYGRGSKRRDSSDGDSSSSTSSSDATPSETKASSSETKSDKPAKAET